MTKPDEEIPYGWASVPGVNRKVFYCSLGTLEFWAYDRDSPRPWYAAFFNGVSLREEDGKWRTFSTERAAMTAALTYLESKMEQDLDPVRIALHVLMSGD